MATSPRSACAQCGVALVPNARFCPRCGVRVKTGFLVPSATAFEWLVIAGWGVTLWLALRATLASLTLPPTGETLSTGALLGWLLRWCAALLVGGAVGGAFVRPRGRWREVFVGGLLIGGVAALFAFSSFFLGHDHSCGQSGDPCDMGDTFGSLMLALPSAALVICGGLAGRAAARTLLRFRRPPDR